MNDIHIIFDNEKITKESSPGNILRSTAQFNTSTRNCEHCKLGVFRTQAVWNNALNSISPPLPAK